MNRRISAALTTGVALAALVACTDSGSDSTVEPSGSVESSAAAPSPTLDPEVQKAVDAYDAFVETSNASLRNPVGKGKSLPKAADFSRWSYDPAEAEAIVFMHVLDSYNAEFRGEEPESHVEVVEVRLDASPYPLVKLADCQVPQGPFVPYNRESDKPLDLVDDEDADQPFLSDIEMIAVKGQWGVRTAVARREGTCQP